MSAESFDELLSCVHGKLTYNSMQMGDAVPAIEKLALTLTHAPADPLSVPR
jgi:hypothetical protein